MSAPSQYETLARYLFEEHRARRRFVLLPANLAPATLEEAYQAQAALVALNSATAGAPAGYKIGLTTPVMQKMLGIDQPAAGVVLASLIHRSPYWLVSTDYVRLGIECEIAVRFGADLSPDQAPFRRGDVVNAIETVMPAIELVEDRAADYAQMPGQAISLICDNVWNAGVVLGGPVANWRAVDLAAVRGKMLINGEAAGEGQGRDVMGNPLEALVWLANLLAKQGKGLAAGMIVLTGSLIPTQFVEAGSEVRFVADTLGEVLCHVTAS